MAIVVIDSNANRNRNGNAKRNGTGNGVILIKPQNIWAQSLKSQTLHSKSRSKPSQDIRGWCGSSLDAFLHVCSKEAQIRITNDHVWYAPNREPVVVMRNPRAVWVWQGSLKRGHVARWLSSFRRTLGRI